MLDDVKKNEVFKEVSINVKKSRRRSSIFWLLTTLFFTAAIAILSLIESDLDLYEIYLLIIPVFALLFHDMFVKESNRLSKVDKVVFTSVIVFYFVSFVVNSIYVTRISVVVVNTMTIALMTYLLRFLLQIIRTNYFVYSLDKMDKKMDDLLKKNNITDDNYSEDVENYVSEYFNACKCLFTFYLSVPDKIIDRKYSLINISLFSIYKSLIRLKTSLYVNDRESIFSDILKTYERLEETFFMYALKSKAKFNDLLSIYFRYEMKKLKYLLKMGQFDFYKEHSSKIVFERQELLIQTRKIIELEDSIRIFLGFFKKEISNEAYEINEEGKTVLVNHLINHTVLFRKYSKESGTLGPIFILQNITSNYCQIIPFIDSHSLYKSIFQVVEILSKQNDDSMSIELYYYLLDNIVDSIDDLSEKVEFIGYIQHYFKQYEETIARHIFNKFNLLYNSGKYNQDEIALALVKMHINFSDSIINYSPKILIDHTFNVNISDDYITAFASLMSSNLKNMNYFFRELYLEIKKGDTLKIGTLFNNSSPLMRIFENILQYSRQEEHIKDAMLIISRLNSKILDLPYSDKFDRKVRAKYYKDFISAYYNHYSSNISGNSQIEIIKWIGVFGKSLVNNDFSRVTLNSLYNIGLRVVQDNNEAEVKELSGAIGWTLFDALKSKDVIEATKKNGLKKLYKFFIKVANTTEYSMILKSYVGTAVILNIMCARIYNNEKDYNSIDHYIRTELGELSNSNKLILLKSCNLKSELLNDFFKNSEREAKKQYERLYKELDIESKY